MESASYVATYAPKVFLFNLAGPVPVQLVPGADELKKIDDPLSSFSF